MLSAFAAAGTFLIFTGGASAAQIRKLVLRRRLFKRNELTKERICEGLTARREFWAFTAYLLFFLSGLTRERFDYVLVFSRLPVLLAALWILNFMWKTGEVGAAAYFRRACYGGIVLLAVTATRIFAAELATGVVVARSVDLALAGVTVALTLGKVGQARQMYRQRRSAAVSLGRELSLMLKDATGFWYTTQVGTALFWVGCAHFASFFSSASIAVVKVVLERGRGQKHADKVS